MSMAYEPAVWDRSRPHSEGRRPAPKPQRMGVIYDVPRPPVATQEAPRPVKVAAEKSPLERKRDAARRYYERHHADMLERKRKRYAERNGAVA